MERISRINGLDKYVRAIVVDFVLDRLINSMEFLVCGKSSSRVATS